MVRVMVNARARVRFSVRAVPKPRASVRVRLTVSIRVRSMAESRASVSVRLWLGPGLVQG